jgi:hypothetical protein
MSASRPHAGNWLLKVLKGIAVLAMWLTAGVLALITLVLLATNFAVGVKFAMAVGIVVGGCRGLASAWGRRRELAQQAAERPELTAEQPYRPSRVQCLHPTRGEGQIIVDDRGDLHFLPGPAAAKYVAYLGLELEATGMLRLIVRRLKAFFSPRFRRQLHEGSRGLAIPRDRLRFALPFSRFVMGPTVLVGYQEPGEKAPRFEEFCLCTVANNQVRVPTADAAGWTRDLGLPEPPAWLRDQILTRRAAVRRRLALADMGVAVVVSGTIVLGIATCLGIAMAAETGPAQGITLAGILTGIWTATMALCTACHLYCSR